MTRSTGGVHAVFALLMLAACAGAVDVPGNVRVGDKPPAMQRGPDVDFAAAPRIDAVWLSSLVLERGRTWSGEITTTSNVASIEVRTDSFSFSVPRRSIGTFAFSYAIPDLPPYLRRPFLLHVVARNAAGDPYDEVVPIEIR